VCIFFLSLIFSMHWKKIRLSDATQSAILLRQVVRLPVTLRHARGHMLEHFKNNFVADWPTVFTLCRPQLLWSTPRESSRNSRWNRGRVDNTRHRVVTYLKFHIHICFYAMNANNSQVWANLAVSRGFFATALLSCCFCDSSRLVGVASLDHVTVVSRSRRRLVNCRVHNSTCALR